MAENIGDIKQSFIVDNQQAIKNINEQAKATDELSQKIEKAVHAMRSMDDAKSELKSAKTNFVQAGAALDRVEQMKAAGFDSSKGSVVWKEEQKAIDELIAAENRLNDAYKEIATQRETEKAAREAERVAIKAKAQEEKAAAKATADSIKQYQKLGSVLSKTLGKSVTGSFALLGKGARVIGRHFKDSAKEALSLERATHKITRAVNGFTSVASRMLKRMAIRAVFQDLGDSMATLEGENNAFNASMSSVICGLKTLNHQLAAMFAPIMNVVAPVLRSITDEVSSFAEKISAFNASITGASTYEKALPVQYNYAEAMGKTAENTDDVTNATKSAAKAQKEYNATILSFDQLHKLNGSNGGNDASGMESVAESAATAAKQFATMPTSAQAKASKFGETLRKAFHEKDWKGMANAISSFVKDGLQRLDNAISWENTGNKIRGFLDGITGTANALIADKDLFALAGTTIGHGIDTIARSFEYFDKNMNWQDFGNSIGVMFNNGLAAVNWSSVGSDLMAFFMIPWEMFNGFIRELDATELGNSIGALISGALERFDGTTIGTAVGTAVTKISQAFAIGFGDKTKWESFGTELVNMLNSFFESVSGSDVAQALNAMIHGIITTAGTLLKNEEFKTNVKNDIKEFISTLDWGGLAVLVAPIIMTKFVIALVPTIIKGIIAKVGSGLATALGSSAAGQAGLSALGAAGILGAGAAGLGAGVLGTKYGNSQIAKGNKGLGSLISIGSGAAGGAAMGAAIGSIVPGIGTAIGAGVGALVGGTASAFTSLNAMDAYNESINNAKNQDVILQVDSTELARATMKGERKMNIINNPQVAFG